MQKIHLLWFEDHFASDFEEIKEELIKHCKLHHRELIIDVFASYPNNFEMTLFDGHYTLAFFDLNLDNGQKGTDVINTIRKYGAYIDILLYSNNPTQIIENTEGKNYIEGIFRHATYKNLFDKMKDVIDQVLYKETMAISRFEASKS